MSKSILRHKCKQCPDNQILTAQTSHDGSCSQRDRVRIAEDAHSAEFCVSAGERAEIRAWALWSNGLIHRWFQNLLRPMGVFGLGCRKEVPEECSALPWFPSATPVLSAAWRPWAKSLSHMALAGVILYSSTWTEPSQTTSQNKVFPFQVVSARHFVTAMRTVTERKESASTLHTPPPNLTGLPTWAKVQSQHSNPILFGLLSRFYSTTY